MTMQNIWRRQSPILKRRAEYEMNVPFATVAHIHKDMKRNVPSL